MKTVVWDVDDVLNDLMQNWLEWFGRKVKKDISYSQIKENPPHRILGICVKKYLQSLDEFRLSKHYQQMQPVKEVFDWFEEYGDKFRHIALTATPVYTASITAQWVLKHFSKWIRTFHFVPSKRNNVIVPAYEREKSDFLKWFNKVDIFIDDNPENVRKAEDIGIKAILWKRPWNNADQSWQEALDELTYL